MSEARLKLQARKDSVDITKIGLQGGVYGGFTTIDVRSLEDAVVRYGVAQALLDGLASTEEGLAVRDILPDLDLRAPDDVVINDRSWAQPSSGFYAVADMMSATNLGGKAIYITSKNSDNDQKVLIIYGIRLVRTGPARQASKLISSAVTFRRGQVKTIDIWQIEMLDTVPDQVIYGRTPLLYKKSDNARIEFNLKSSGYYFGDVSSGQVSATLVSGGVSGSREHLMFLGKIIEKIGDQVTG
jgi:hypothetical protein